MPTHVVNPSAKQPTPQWGYPSAPQGGVPPPATSYPLAVTPVQVIFYLENRLVAVIHTWIVSLLVAT